MAIKRIPKTDPNWGPFEYATLSTNGLFSKERWGQAVKWDLLLEQAHQIKRSVLLLTKAPFPTSLFSTYIDILDNNFDIFLDMFFYLTGERLSDGVKDGVIPPCNDETWYRLRFWNMDCKDTIQKIADSLSESQNIFRNILQRDDLSKLKMKLEAYAEPEKEVLLAKLSPDEESVYNYVCRLYHEDTDINALAQQIDGFLDSLDWYTYCISQWGYIYDFIGDFTSLLTEFRNSEKGKNLVKGWEQELNGDTREYLIAQLEKDERYKPWIFKYIHIGDKEEIIRELCDNSDLKTSTLIDILSMATLLKEYDERHVEGNKDIKQDSDSTITNAPPKVFPNLVTLLFFDKNIYVTAEEQQRLRKELQSELTNIDASSGREWFAFYAAYRYVKKQNSAKHCYVHFFSDIEKLLPESIPNLKKDEIGDKRYKHYTLQLSKEVNNWYVDGGKLPPLNRLVWNDYIFHCKQDLFSKLEIIIKRLFNKLNSLEKELKVEKGIGSN